MKVILSHDVDHLYWSDHALDTFYPGLFLRSSKAMLKGEIKSSELIRRFSFSGQLNRIKELSTFLKDRNLPASFFFGMRTGLNLSYDYQKAGKFINTLKSQGFDVGVHGMAFDDLELMKEERERFKEISGNYPKSIRNHYLRNNEKTFDLMNQLGYKSDSTLNGIMERDKIGDLNRIPISQMDVDVMKEARLAGKSMLEISLEKLEEAESKNLDYFVVNFHDIYFSKAYLEYKEWFETLLNALIARNYSFVDFKTAISEID